MRSAGRCRRRVGYAPVHHALPAELLVPKPIKPSYFAFLGRIAPEKRVDLAIRIAEHCGVPLKIAAKVDKADQDYFNEQIKPMLASSTCEYIGEIKDQEKSEFLSGAITLLIPIDWPEPFGLVMIEAMACGTPVIAFNRGSAPELVDDGVTGFVVEDVSGAIGAIDRLGHLSNGTVKMINTRAVASDATASVAPFDGERCGPTCMSRCAPRSLPGINSGSSISVSDVLCWAIASAAKRGAHLTIYVWTQC
jgi:glycosyltransferase involved in cell wall biosynthesis